MFLSEGSQLGIEHLVLGQDLDQEIARLDDVDSEELEEAAKSAVLVTCPVPESLLPAVRWPPRVATATSTASRRFVASPNRWETAPVEAR